MYTKGCQHNGQKTLSGNTPLIWLINYLSFSMLVVDHTMTTDHVRGTDCSSVANALRRVGIWVEP